MTAAKLRLAMASMGQPETKVGRFCEELWDYPVDALPASRVAQGRICGQTA
jgi:hypothetical protein